MVGTPGERDVFIWERAHTLGYTKTCVLFRRQQSELSPDTLLTAFRKGKILCLRTCFLLSQQSLKPTRFNAQEVPSKVGKVIYLDIIHVSFQCSSLGSETLYGFLHSHTVVGIEETTLDDKVACSECWTTLFCYFGH